MNNKPVEFLQMLFQAGLANEGETPVFEELTGGVASDIWLVHLRQGPVCVKRALAKLKVAQDWQASVDRNAFEAAWLEIAARIVPGAAPRVLAHDADAGMFALEYLDPAQFKSWKDELLDGRAIPAFSAEVGRRLGKIHSATAGDRDIAKQFSTDDIFHAMRLSPYLEATATAHPALAGPLMALLETTAANHFALVHGDVSPKNILNGPEGPVFLDAECAWYGDPAFDLAFCLKHLMLKCLVVPASAAGYMECFDAMVDGYLNTLTEELRGTDKLGIEARTARLLPGLFLARVDGKSPVEYLTQETDRERVRHAATGLLLEPAARLGDVRRVWEDELSKGSKR
jgi:tRNA A-37 threonylcarbamoyl transferase component Bud32